MNKLINKYKSKKGEIWEELTDKEQKIFEKGKQEAQSQFLEMLDKTKIIKNEFCICGHSKDCHGIHQLDKHGSNCNQCKCSIYTWKDFEFVDLEPIKSQLTGEEK